MEYIAEICSGRELYREPMVEEAFFEQVDSHHLLHVCMMFTRNLCVLIEAYRNIEELRHKISLDHALRGDVTHSKASIMMDAPIVGYLASARIFLEWPKGYLRKTLPDIYNEYDNARKKTFSVVLDYKLAECLRNYSQHEGLPISKVTFSTRVEDPDKILNSNIRYAVNYLISKNIIENSHRFSDLSQSDKDSLPDYINIISLIRSHLSKIGKMHNYIADLITPLAAKANQRLETFKHDFLSRANEEKGLLRFVQKKDGQKLSEVYCNTDIYHKRTEMLKSVSGTNIINRHVVSNEI